MKKQIRYLVFLLLCAQSLNAQDFQEISTGAGYSKQSFINLSSGQQSLSDNAAWDIAFAAGSFDVGVFINESAGTSMGQPTPAIELYDALTHDFSDLPDPASLEDLQLFNGEESWSSGAFNEGIDESNPFDFGWGIYDPVTHVVSGDKVFVVSFRNGEYRKLQVQSLNGPVFTFRYANLDGTGETVKTISKSDHAGKTLAYFSFGTGATVDIEPAGGFDLLYCRYISPLFDPGSMTTIPYAVTGILSGKSVEVARADGVDPTSVSFDQWQDSLKTELDIIGYEWKSFSGTVWSLDEDLVYFVKTANGTVWKIQFIDFEGSSTGNAVFQKTNLGTVNAVGDPNSPLATFDVFPNPVSTAANIVFSANKTAGNEASLILFDVNGRLVLQNKLNIQPGLNGHVLPVSGLQNGVYVLSLNIDNQVFTQRIVVAH